MYEYSSLGYEPVGDPADASSGSPPHSLDNAAGFVWRVRARNEGGQLAGEELVLKVWQKPGSYSQDEDYLAEKRLREEALHAQQAVAGQSPNWVRVVRMGRVEENRRLAYPDGVFGVFERVGRSLEQVLDEAPIHDERVVRAIAEGMLGGLSAWHGHAKRAHGNLKPSNVLVRVGADGRAATAALTDPAVDGAAAALEDDLRFVGETIVRLVMGKARGPVTSPRATSDEWKKLGGGGESLRQMAVLLIDGSDAAEKRLAEALKAVGGAPGPQASAEAPKAGIPLPEKLGLIETAAAGVSFAESERAWVDRAVADVGRRADRVRRGVKAATEALGAFGRKDALVAGADACVQRTFAAKTYADAKEALAGAATAHERAAKALENIAGWLKSPVGFTGGAADFRPNGKAHDLAAMDADKPSSPDGARVEDLESWIDRAKRHIIVLVEKLGEEVGLVRLEADERFEVPSEYASEWEAKRHIIDEMARDIRTLARTLSRDSVPDDQVLKRAPEAVPGEFEQTRPHFDLETVVERLLESHTRVRATLGPIGKVLYPEAGGKNASQERNEEAIADACRGAWIRAGDPLTAATLDEWLKRASVSKKPVRPAEFLPEKIGLISLRPELRLELDDDELAAWNKLRPDLERDAGDMQAFAKELRADPVLARALESVQSTFDGGSKKAKAGEVMDAARAAHADARRRLLAIRDWMKAFAEDGSGRTNAKARDVGALVKSAKAPKGAVTGSDIDAWLERAKALPLIELEKPKAAPAPPPPTPAPEKKVEKASESPAPVPVAKAPEPPAPKPVEKKRPEKPVPAEVPPEAPAPKPTPAPKPAPAPVEKKPPKKPEKAPAPAPVQAAPVAEVAGKAESKSGKKSGAGLWIGVAAAVIVVGGGGLFVWKPWAGGRGGTPNTTGGTGTTNGTGVVTPPVKTFDVAFKTERDALAVFTSDPRAAQAEATARGHFEGADERWDETRTRTFLREQLVALRPADAPGFTTRFADLIKRVNDEYTGGPGESAARAAQQAALASYQKKPTDAEAIAAEFQRALTSARRKFDVEFAPLLRQADATPGAATNQGWLDERKKQVDVWNGSSGDRAQMAAAMSAVLDGLKPVTAQGTAFGTIWAKEPEWSRDVTESDWQVRTWGQIHDQLRRKYGKTVAADRVADLEKDKADAWSRLTSVPQIASATPEEIQKLGRFTKSFEDRIKQLNEERRAGLEGYAIGTTSQAPANASAQRGVMLAVYGNAEESLGALRAGWALDERPAAVAWTGNQILRTKLGSVLAQKDVPATELGLDGWSGVESEAEWPAAMGDLDRVPADQQRAAWRSALHRWIADATTTKGAAPDAWTNLLASMNKLAALPASNADAQKREDFNRLAVLLDAFQPAANHAVILDALASMGTLGAPAAGAPDPFPVLRANLALRKLVGKGADAGALALLKAIGESPASAKVPDARRLYDNLTTRPVDSNPPQGWAPQGTLGDPSVVMRFEGTGDQVGFVLLRPTSADASRTYLAADEMPAKLFVTAINRLSAQRRNIVAPTISDGDLPRSWHIKEDGTFVLYGNSELQSHRYTNPKAISQALRPWLAISEPSSEEAAVFIGGAPAAPTADSPAQLLSPKLAQAAAESVGMRLPTTSEWSAAFSQASPTFENDGAGPALLAGDRWNPVTITRILGSAVFADAKGGGGPAPATLFESTEPAATSFRHLIGNVAEVVLNGNQFQAVGGSAFATRGQFQTPADAAAPKPIDTNSVDVPLTDLGLRLAFSTAAAKPPPVVGPNDLLARRP